jgi:hypothetical protein
MISSLKQYLSSSTYESYIFFVATEKEPIPKRLVKKVVDLFREQHALEKLTVFGGINTVDRAYQLRELGVMSIGIDNVLQDGPATAREIVSFAANPTGVMTLTQHPIKTNQ